MTPSRHAEAVRSLNGAASKVLAAVPIGEAWPLRAIQTELVRQGVNSSVRVTQACLSTLVGLGLVKLVRGDYIQVQPRLPDLKPMPEPEPEPSPKEEPVPITFKSDVLKSTDNATLTSLANIAETLRLAANQIEDLALQIESRVAESEKAAAKLRQLQELLKGLS